MHVMYIGHLQFTGPGSHPFTFSRVNKIQRDRERKKREREREREREEEREREREKKKTRERRERERERERERANLLTFSINHLYNVYSEKE